MCARQPDQRRIRSRPLCGISLPLKRPIYEFRIFHCIRARSRLGGSLTNNIHCVGRKYCSFGASRSIQVHSVRLYQQIYRFGLSGSGNNINLHNHEPTSTQTMCNATVFSGQDTALHIQAIFFCPFWPITGPVNKYPQLLLPSHDAYPVWVR